MPRISFTNIIIHFELCELNNAGQNMTNVQKTKKSQKTLRLDFERKTRLELATLTLARLCSTN